jgi:hypothetical protein
MSRPAALSACQENVLLKEPAPVHGIAQSPFDAIEAGSMPSALSRLSIATLM